MSDEEWEFYWDNFPHLEDEFLVPNDMSIEEWLEIRHAEKNNPEPW